MQSKDTPENQVELSPEDFSEVFKSIPKDCVLIGGQAVAVWAQYYNLGKSVTSKDIDFWGSTARLKELAARLNTKVYTPHEYEMTWLSGAIRISVAGRKTSVELLHHVPGLDDENITRVAIPVNTHGIQILILTPVSLLLTKLYAVRHFDQKDRDDLEHLKIAIAASKVFLAEVAPKDVKYCLWNCNRLITAFKDKRHQKLEKQYQFQLLNAIPVETFRTLAQNQSLQDHQKFANFLDEHLARTIKQAAPKAA